MDQVTRRYETFEDVLEYCRHSANPVGLLYLTLIDHNDYERRALSNATCTALQLAISGRMCGATMPWDASTSRRRTCGGSATRRVNCRGECTPAFRELMAFQVDRTRRLFAEGLPLVDMLDGIFKLHVKLFTLGGLRVLDAIEGQKYDVLSKRPTVTKTRRTWLLAKTWLQMKLTRQI